jgi:hypothetical protein
MDAQKSLDNLNAIVRDRRGSEKERRDHVRDGYHENRKLVLIKYDQFV